MPDSERTPLKVHGAMIHEREIEFRKRRFEQIRSAMDAFPGAPAAERERDEPVEQLRAVLGTFRNGGDLESFRRTLDQMSRSGSVREALPGFNIGVAMFLNQLARVSDGREELDDMLREGLRVPASESEADERIGALVELVERIREGGHPAPKSAATFYAFFWWLQAPGEWPFWWPGTDRAVSTLGWVPSGLDPVVYYRRYRETIRCPGESIDVVDRVLRWFDVHPWTGLDVALVERLEWAKELYEARVDGEYPAGLAAAAEANAGAFLAEMRILGDLLESAVTNATGRELRRHVASPYWVRSEGSYRADAWVKWKTTGMDAEGWNTPPSIAMHATTAGLLVGFSPGRRDQGWAASTRQWIEDLLPEDMDFYNLWDTPGGGAPVLAAAEDGDRREYVAGRFFPGAEMLARPDLADEVERIAAALQPAFDRVMSRVIDPDSPPEPPDPGEDLTDDPVDLDQRLEDLWTECYLPDREFIDELVELLDDKRQIVLYGPPGTGKTYIARKLAEALAPDADHRRFVQFHPSTSYEDFFEGYRPVTDTAGQLSYALERGPLAQLAEHARTNPGTHVLVIDELNRANVPKVFGELLFLLEYRDEEVTPLYRPEGFKLPKNLWVIATMNTADRSIALLDAALRRRFHFVGVFPDEEPVEGLLRRYLEREGGDIGWANLIEIVNIDLRDRLGSGDQLIGPSHFMSTELDEARMKRIWRYNVEPLIDDLFHGDRESIRWFKWEEVLARYRDQIAEPEAPSEAPVEHPGPQ